MNWKFIKTNWFTIALVLLVLVYIIRKNLPPGPGKAVTPEHKEVKEATPEKYTSAESNTFLGFSLESARGGSQKHSPNEAAAVAFLQRFGKVAMSERKKFGVPASVLLACAYVNSSAGQRETATAANNYFALSCSDEWEGETSKVGGKCVRRYETAWASFRDFSIFLTSQEWFGSVRKSAGKDWRMWAKELDQKGISDGSELEKVITAYRLYDLDEK